MSAQRRALARRGLERRVHLNESLIAARSSVLLASRWLENPGVESAQSKRRIADEHLYARHSRPPGARLSYSKVRALTRVATPETEERLLAVGRAGTTEHVERIIRGWRRVDRNAEAREAARQHAGRALHVYPDEDGAVTVRGRLTPEIGALLVQALAAAREAVYPKNVPAGTCAPGVPQGTPTMEQQQADALALLAETALHHGIDPGAPGERYQVVIHVDAEVLADPDQPGQSVIEDRARGPAGTSQRLACDASRVVMRHGLDGRVVEVAARTRTI